MADKWLHRLFLILLAAGLAAGLVRTALFPKEINAYENRYAVTLPALSLSGFLDGEYQDGVDGALADQIPFAQRCKRYYNRAVALGFQASVRLLSDLMEGRYLSYDGCRLFGDHLTYNTSVLSGVVYLLDPWAESWNARFAAHPETEFYVFYIEKDTDIDFETGEKAGVREYVLDALALPEDRKGAFVINSYRDFAESFYRTDHHWNYEGSWRGYLQIRKLLGVTEAPAKRGEAVTLGTMSGSKAIGSASEFREEFSAAPYALPPMDVTLNGRPAEDYGNQDAFFSGAMQDPNYSAFYGMDAGELILDTGTEGRGRLLVLGESFDNAIIKPLASHFDRTYSVDLRYYSYLMGRQFRLSDYLRDNGIDRVLLMGNADFFLSPEFCPED